MAVNLKKTHLRATEEKCPASDHLDVGGARESIVKEEGRPSCF